MKKIVIPYDFSEQADYALDAAIQYSQIVPSALHLVHVIEVPSSYLTLFPEYGALGIDAIYSDEILDVIKSKLDKIVDDLTLSDVKISSSISFGKPFDSIQKVILDQEADLIIMGSKGATGLREIFIGSNTERVIRYAKVPVLTIKNKIDFSNMSDMIFATDFTPDRALDFAIDIQKLLNLKIRLLKVYNSNEWTFTEKSARERTEEFGIANGMKNYSVHIIDSPFVIDGVLRFAHEKKSDLIVMGTHGYTGIGHLIAGSNAEGVANHSKIPIFTVHK